MSHAGGAVAVLRDGIRQFAQISQLLRSGPRIRAWAVERTASQNRIGSMPDLRSLAEVADALRGVTSPSGWAGLAPRVRRLAAWALWSGQPEPIRIRGVLGSLRDEAKFVRGNACLKSMIGSYFHHFDPEAAGFLQYAGALQAVLAKRGDSFSALWRERDAEFALFDPGQGPKRIATVLLHAPHPAEVFSRSGLADRVPESLRFIEAAHGALYPLLGQELFRTDRSEALDRLMPVLETPQRALQAPNRRAVLATGILSPWLAPRSVPSNALREALTAFLLRHLGDPRRGDKKGNWSGAQECQALFCRWLARETLDDFFEFISDRTDSQQWPYRRAFWKALAAKGVIEDAWVVLDRRGFMAAKGRLGDEIGCGRLSDRASTDQSVILLHVGRVIFSEISHNGALHAWRANDPAAPPFHRQHYLWEEIYHPGLEFPGSQNPGCLWHRGAAAGQWQRRCADLIREESGITILPAEWIP